MDRLWLRQLQSQVNKRKRLFESPGFGQSRRQEGIFNRDNEVHGFKHICIYVDAGLVGRERQIAEILGCVDSQIYGYERYPHTRWLMFFGTDPERLTESRSVRVPHALRTTDWEGRLRKFISPEAPPGPAIIPRLHNPGSPNTRCPERYDLALFFCRDRAVLVRSEEEQTRIRKIDDRCIWIFFNDEEAPQMEARTFIPQVIAGCISQK